MRCAVPPLTKQLTLSTAIVVNCLPAFAIVLRKHVVPTRETGNSNSRPYAQNSLSQKGRIRTESMLLDDIAPVEAGRRSTISRDGSENWSQHCTEHRSKVGVV